MSTTTWEDAFRAVHARGLASWKAGRCTAKTMFAPDDVAFLASIGCTAQELFDFVEDLADYGEPDVETVLRITALRRAYFLDAQGGKPSGRVASMSELPAKSDAVDGISWLPRLIEKARLKLRGEMPPDLMYGCAGDRPFLARMRTNLPDFLELVRASGNDDRAIVDAVKRTAGLDTAAPNRGR